MTPARAEIRRESEQQVDVTAWGRLVWSASRALGNSATMTVGRCHIAPGRANPRHYHPNCDEVLHVLSGTVRHSHGDQTAILSAGDTISIPAGTVHNATNIGDTEAVCAISFSSPDREVVEVSEAGDTR